MPRPQEIISGLNSIANDYKLFAVIWHVIIYFLLLALVAQWEPSNRLLGTLICLPLFTVAAFAWLSGNPFNGSLFAIMAILILVFGLKSSLQPIGLSQLPFVIIGIMMIIFGLVYPHFIETNSIFKYLYASPFGLIPCPTLSILIGFVLLFNGFGSQSIILTFIVAGLFYGFFGAFKLGVYLDLFLILGTLTLSVKFILALLK